MRKVCVRLQSLISLAILLAAFGCSDGSLSSPTSPTPPMVPSSPAPPSGSGRFLLSGRVTETPPTVNTGIGRATVRIADGPDAGQSATTDSMGYYTIHDVTLGSAIHVSAAGYLATSSPRETGHDQSDFQLMPLPASRTSVMTDTLHASVGTCNDGVSAKPCHIMAIPIHNNGILEATLEWNSPDAANLDVSLFRSNLPSPVLRAATAENPEHFRVDLRGGAVFELRVTYASGTAPVKYTLRVTHQN